MNTPQPLGRLTVAAVICLALASLTGCSAAMTSQNLASTTNNLFNSSSAGLGSSTDISITQPEGHRYASARAYTRSQMPMIRREAATGHGDNLEALATLMGETDTQAFGQWMQANYARLFTDLDKPETLVQRIRQYRQTDLANRTTRQTTSTG